MVQTQTPTGKLCESDCNVLFIITTDTDGLYAQRDCIGTQGAIEGLGTRQGAYVMP
jgi:hypothetical protein